MSITTPAGLRSGLAMPILALAGLLALLGWQTGLWRLPGPGAAAEIPATVRIAPRPYSYRAEGSFLAMGAAVDGPMIEIAAPPALEIMTYEVSVGEYARCVSEGACEPAQRSRTGTTADHPVTGVSYDDTQRYAAWLTARTGIAWRLPTVAEWVFAAGSRAADEALGLKPDAANPARRWIATYEREAAAASGAALPEPRGAGGHNEFGVADLSGAVWEWTASCDGRTTLDAEGLVLRKLDSCGAHYLEGRHRAAMTNFVRDAASGGCATGVPPDNLGFRLVRDRNWVEALVERVARLRPWGQ